jgi:chorismate lyase/3-hydroxybenzoate synthase
MIGTGSSTDCFSAPSDHHCRLAINLGREVLPISSKHELLVGFHFGSDSSPNDRAGIVSVGLDPTAGGDFFECWWYQGSVGHKKVGNAEISICDDYSVVKVQVPDAKPQNFRAKTFDAYQELLSIIQRIEHPHLAKIWNYFPGINDDVDDQEKYRQFSMGRADSFDQFGIVDTAVPTGTAIGCIRESGLTVVALISRNHFLSAENPRQVSAFKYPQQYGPKSPKFSRGGSVSAESHDLLILSGTAAIIGHESVHPNNVSLQLNETLTNLDHVCNAISGLRRKGKRLLLGDEGVLRVYLRDPGDLEFVASELAKSLGNIKSNVVFLNADICRRELAIEIDGVQILS